MAMAREEIEQLLRQAFPDADIAVAALADDGDHYAAAVQSAAFNGKTKVQQHQMVYAALEGRVGGVLHALQLTTAPKETGA
jgi:stress-induced morphogen